MSSRRRHLYLRLFLLPFAAAQFFETVVPSSTELQPSPTSSSNPFDSTIFPSTEPKTVVANRRFPKRPRHARKDRHRHSTKVDGPDVPVVLLPPFLSSNDQHFVPSILDNSTSSRQIADDKTSNFVQKIPDGSRGKIKYVGDYSPPPTRFPSSYKYRQVGRGNQRRRFRTSTEATSPSTILSSSSTYGTTIELSTPSSNTQRIQNVEFFTESSTQNYFEDPTLSRVEVNVATSTSRLVESPSTETSDDTDYQRLFQPLTILTPPFLEDEYHDETGNISNLTLDIETTTITESTVPSTELSTTSVVSTESTISCDNADCRNDPQSLQKPWTKLPIISTDVRTLSQRDGVALINKMYENLLRVLEGGTDYFDLNDDDTTPDERFETNSLVVAETGDRRNDKYKSFENNAIGTSRPRGSRRKDAHSKNSIRNLKRPKVETKASSLCSSKLGYVADISTGCKVFYVCTELGVGEPMHCPNGTLFNQDYLVCDWWYNVECS